MTAPDPPAPPSSDAPSAPPPLVDTTPAAHDRTALTYTILLCVLAALVAYFVIRVVRAR